MSAVNKRVFVIECVGFLTDFDGGNVKRGAEGHDEDHADPHGQQAGKGGPDHKVQLEQAERPRELCRLGDGPNQSVISSSLMRRKRKNEGRRRVNGLAHRVDRWRQCLRQEVFVDCISSCR